MRYIIEFIRESIRDRMLIIRYGISGVTGILSNMSALYIATEFLHVWYLASAAFSFLVGLGVTFALQKFWTFRRTEGNARMQFASYTGIALVSLLLDVTLLYIFVQWLNLWYMFAQGIALGIIALGSYLANRHYTFSRL